MIGLTPHQTKALNFENSIALTANAGSGKTFVLTQRYLEIILRTDTKINKVAAITFTEKAAGELYKRISSELNRIFHTTDNLQLKQRVEKIRKQIVSAKISTIHSFCIDLLKEYPVEASVDANFIPINEQRTAEIINLSIEKSIKSLLRDPAHQNEIKLLTRLLGSKLNLVKEVTSLLHHRKNILNLYSSLNSTSQVEIAEKYQNLFNSTLKIIFNDELPRVITHLNIVNNKVLENNSSNELANELNRELLKLEKETDELNFLRKLKEISSKILTKDGSIRKQVYLSAQLREEIMRSVVVIESFFSDLTEINFNDNNKNIDQELVKYALALFRIFEYVLTEFEITKSELGVLDFEDILLKTKKLLDNKSVKESILNKYKYLLVDEYQDTNEIQYNIFLPLLDDLKQGNLFIVGDEKQSIYRFRDAELQVFAKTKADIQKESGQNSLLTLPDSFRLAPSICFFVNSIFRILFKEPRLFFNEVESSDLICARTDNFQGQVEFLVAEGNEEADLVAQRIVKLKSERNDRIKSWNDIAVLVRKRASFTELQKAFIKYHIPFNIVGGTGFYQQQSISDIYNYFCFLLNDKDDAALIGLLRSPFFFVSDTEILELSSFEGEYYWDKINSATKKNYKNWGGIHKKISENRELVNRIETPQLLRKILSESFFLTALSSRVNEMQEISNLYKLISITNDFFTEEFNTIYDYTAYLSNAISQTQDEAQAGIQPGSNGVNILTIHQAKGLEFSAVFLFNCSDFTSVNKVKAKSFTIDKEFGLLTKVPLNEDYFGEYCSAPIVGLYNLIESKKDYAELKRLFYVAMTRAKDFLFISQNTDKSIKKNSFTGLLKEALNPDYEKENFQIEGELSFLEKTKDSYINKSRSISLEIRILRDVNVDEFPVTEFKIDHNNLKFYLSEVEDHSIGEVISSTRFSTFYSCPFKYNLLYNYRIGALVNESGKFNSSFRSDFQDEYNRNELDSYLFDDELILPVSARFKGKLIHYVLNKNISRKNLSHFLEYRIGKSAEHEKINLVKNEILDNLLSIYESEEYRYLNSFVNYKNEYEVYLKEKDYYLFGILDKLIIDSRKLIIVDYKTDKINQNKIRQRADLYLPQLKFYAYIISRIFEEVQEIECRIIFLKFPENPIVFKYDNSSDLEINKNIKRMIQSIRTLEYAVNLEHCKECVFIDNNSRCIQLNKKS